MKFCTDEWKSKVESYIEDQLPSSSIPSVEEHLKTCKICSESVAEEQHIRSVIHTLPKLTLSDSFDSKLKTRMDKIQAEKRNPLFKYIEIYIIIFLLIIGAITYLGFELFTELQGEQLKKHESVEKPSEKKEVVHPHGVDGL